MSCQATFYLVASEETAICAHTHRRDQFFERHEREQRPMARKNSLLLVKNVRRLDHPQPCDDSTQVDSLPPLPSFTDNLTRSQRSRSAPLAPQLTVTNLSSAAETGQSPSYESYHRRLQSEDPELTQGCNGRYAPDSLYATNNGLLTIRSRRLHQKSRSEADARSTDQRCASSESTTSNTARSNHARPQRSETRQRGPEDLEVFIASRLSVWSEDSSIQGEDSTPATPRLSEDRSHHMPWTVPPPLRLSPSKDIAVQNKHKRKAVLLSPLEYSAEWFADVFDKSQHAASAMESPPLSSSPLAAFSTYLAASQRSNMSSRATTRTPSEMNTSFESDVASDYTSQHHTILGGPGGPEFLHANKVYIRRINSCNEAVRVVTIPRHGLRT